MREVVVHSLLETCGAKVGIGALAVLDGTDFLSGESGGDS
jgi:hypothetical protein